MEIPKLYVFAISHYCEKARWALDYLQVPYELVFLAPGYHAFKLKKLGFAKSSVPALRTANEAVQGSAEIIDWAETWVGSRQVNTGTRSLLPALNVNISSDEVEIFQGIEKRLDKVSGAHIRRYYYSEALVEYPKTVMPYLSMNLSFIDLALFKLTRPLLCRLMVKGMGLGFTQGQASREKLEVELAWLDGLLSDGRKFFCCLILWIDTVI